MKAGVAGLQMHGVMVLVVVRGGSIVLVRGKAVMVLRMIVIRVLVDVQRRDLAGGRRQDQSEQNRNGAMHLTSVCNGWAGVKRTTWLRNRYS
jgi:hypothetical protein